MKNLRWLYKLEGRDASKKNVRGLESRSTGICDSSGGSALCCLSKKLLIVQPEKIGLLRRLS